MKRFWILLFFISANVHAAIKYNPFTGKPDYVGSGSSTVITCGSNPTGLAFVDANSCTWCTTIATTGNLVTTLVSCPSVLANRSCVEGEPVGLLLSLVCGKNVR